MKMLNIRTSGYRILITMISLAMIVLLWSCYPDAGMSSLGDRDLIVTQYDPEINFSNYATFVLPDSVVHLVPEGEEDNVTHKYDEQILAEVEENMTKLGYTKVDTSGNPDLTMFVYATSSTWKGWSYYPGWGGGWGWWGYYPPYWGPGYGGWAVPYEFTTGTLSMDMIDNSTWNLADSTADAVWVGGFLGLLDDTESNIRYRLTRDIDQAFNQSPYLGRN